MLSCCLKVEISETTNPEQEHGQKATRNLIVIVPIADFKHWIFMDRYLFTFNMSCCDKNLLQDLREMLLHLLKKSCH